MGLPALPAVEVELPSPPRRLAANASTRPCCSGMPACKRAGPPAGRFLGLRLSFFLPSSCYATMLIRELTKKPTDKDFQMSLQH